MRLRVLQICCAPPPAGIDLAALLQRWPTLPDVAEAVSKAGADVTVLQLGQTDEGLRAEGVLYRYSRALRGPTLSDPFCRGLAAAARRYAPDVIHMSGLEFPVQTRALSATGIPVLVQDHASRPRGRGAPLWRWGLGKVAGAAFTAHAQAEPFLRSEQLPARAHIFVIPESSSRFNPGPRDAARARCGVFGSPALLWVGHLDANKDPLTALRAVRIAKARLPALELWCAFEQSPLRQEVDHVLDDPVLRSCVHLLGAVPHPQMETLYRACDGFVSASRREGSGYALIEALACGLPPIVSDIPSFRELTGDGAVGALVPAGDADALAQAIVAQFHGTRPSADEERMRIRRHFEAKLSFQVIGAKLIAAYAALAEGSAA